MFGDRLNGVSNATRRKNTKKTKKKILEDGKKSLGASQLLFDGGLFILSNLGNLCGALEGLVKATEFGDKKGTKRHFQGWPMVLFFFLYCYFCTVYCF